MRTYLRAHGAQGWQLSPLIATIQRLGDQHSRVANRSWVVGRNRQIPGLAGYNGAVSISRRIARPLLASAFIAEGWSLIRNPDPDGIATEVLVPSPSQRDSNVVVLVRLNGAVQVGGGVLLALGKFPRLASLALMGTIIPTTYAGHRFWEEPDDESRAQKRMQLLKNLGLLGGLIFSAIDTEGAPSVSWRTRRRVSRLADTLSQKHVPSEVHAHEAVSKAVDRGRTAGGGAKRTARRAVRRANVAAVEAVREANETAFEVSRDALDSASPYISAGLERTGELLEGALEVAGPYISAGFERAGELFARIPEHLSDE